MKSVLTVGLLLFAIWHVAVAENLIPNPGFEDGVVKKTDVPLPGWKIRGAGGVLKYHHVVKDSPHGGERCALIQIPEDAPAKTTCYFQISKNIKLPAGKTYRLTFWARPLEGNAVMRMVQYSAKGTYNGIRELKINSDPNVKTWRRYTLEWMVPTSGGDFRNYVIMVMKTGHGTLYLDDFSLEEITPENYKVDFYPSSANQNQTQTLPVVKGDLAHLIIYPYTVEKSSGHTLELDLPRGMTLLTAQPVYLGRGHNIKISSQQEGERTVYQVPLISKSVFPMALYTSSRQRGTALLFRVDDNIRQDNLNWKLLKAGKTAVSGSIKIVPENFITGKLPEKFRVYDWYSPLLSFMDDPDLLKIYIKHMQKSGFAGGSLIRSSLSEVFNQEKFANFRCTYLGRAKDNCLTGMIEDDYLIKAIDRSLGGLNKFENAYLNWDFEPLMPEYYHWCERCKAAFEKYSDKSTENMKSGNEVEKAYPQEFLKFRSSQHYTIAKLFIDRCKEQGVKPVLCSFARSGSESANKRIEKMVGDQKSYYKYCDMITPMIYHTPDKLWEPLQINQKFYPGIIPVYTSDERGNGNSPGYALLTPECVYLETMIAAMLQCRGIGLFVGYHAFNGQQINALRKALYEIAVVEDMLFSEEDAPADALKVLQSSPVVRYNVYRKGDRLMLGVINPDTEKSGFMQFQANPQWKNFSIKDVKSQKYYSRDKSCVFNNKDKCVVELAPGEVLFLELEKAVSGKVMTKAMPGIPQAVKPEILINDDNWQCVKKSGILEISGPAGSFQVYPADGGVLGGKNILASGDGNGGFFRDLLLVPKAANWCADSRSGYTVKSVSSVGRDLKIVLSRKYRLAAVAGLEIEKTYTFAANGTVRANIRLINGSSKPMKLAYWSHNRTDIAEGKAYFTYGKNNILNAAEKNTPDFKAPAEVPYVISEKSVGSIECLAGAVDKYYFWLGSNGASMEFFGKTQVLEANKEYSLTFVFTPSKNNSVKKKGKITMDKYAFPADSRIAWFWYNDQEIFFDSEEDIGRKLDKFKQQGITHLITFSCTHFRWNFKPWWPKINECIGKIVRQAHKRGLKVIEHHSSHLIYFPDTPERQKSLMNSFGRRNGSPDNYPGLFKHMTDKNQPLMQRLQTDPYGKPQNTAYSGFGHCFNNEDYRKEYLEYLESVYALGVDGIMTDDVQYFGYGCFCKTCQKLFKAKYNVDMPLGDDYIKRTSDIRDPLVQKFMEFRVDSLLDFHRCVADHMTSKGLRLLRPNYVSNALCAGDMAQTLARLPQLDVFFQEACFSTPIRYCWPDYLAEQLYREMTGRHRGIRHMIMFYADRDDSLRFSWGLCRWAGALLTNTSEISAAPDETTIRKFEKKYLDYCFDNEPLKGVAFLDSRSSSLKSGSYLASRFFFWIESCIFGNIPTALVSIDRPDEFGDYKVLCVNEVPMLSDAEIAVLKKYAANGGTLVVTGRSGDMDENARMRSPEEYRKVWGFELLPPMNEVKVIAHGKGRIVRTGAGFGYPGTDKEKNYLFEDYPNRFKRDSVYELMNLRKHIHWVWVTRRAGEINSYVDNEANYAQHKAVFYQVADFLRGLLEDSLELKTVDFPELVLCRGYIKSNDQAAEGVVLHVLNAGKIFPEKVGETLAHEDIIPFPDWSGNVGKIIVKLPEELVGSDFKASWHDLRKTADLDCQIKADKAIITVPFDLLKDYGMIQLNKK